VTATAIASGPARLLYPVLARARHHPRRPGSSAGIGISRAATTILLRTAGRLPHAGHHHRGTYTVRARARALGRPSGALGPWARDGGLRAMNAAGMVAEAAQGRTLPLCARVALDLGRLLGLGPGPGPALGLGLSLGLVLAHVPAHDRGRRHTPRIPGDAAGPGPTAEAVEVIVGMISGTADLVHPITKIYDGKRTQFRGPGLRFTSIQNVSQIRCCRFIG
jgi:hypothetical protein